MPKGAARSATLGGGAELLPANVILAFDGTDAQASALTDYTRVASLDGYFLVGVDSNNPGDPVGSATHTHDAPHTHTSPPHSHGLSAVSAYTRGFSYSNLPVVPGWNPHTHPGTSPAEPANLTTETSPLTSANNDPDYYDVIWIESLIETVIPAGALAWSNTNSIPAEWSLHASSNNRFLKGAVTSGDAGATGGSVSHSHADLLGHAHGMPHTHGPIAVGPTGKSPNLNFSNPPQVVLTSFAPVSTDLTHTHPDAVIGVSTAVTSSVTLTSTTDSNEPPFLKLIIYQGSINEAPIFPGMIIATLLNPASIPDGWAICDGTLGTPDLRGAYIKNTNTSGDIGVSGGASAHSHDVTDHTHTGGNHGHPGSTGSNPTPASYQYQDRMFIGSHSHPIANATASIDPATGLTTTTTSNFPASKAVLFIMKV